MHLKLVSFKLCPFVQRAVITLNIKALPYDIEYIDLENKPGWFLKISPTGKVPVLIVDDREIIFESAVINEFLDEQKSPYLLPPQPLDRAKQRGWIDFAGSLTMGQYKISVASNEEKFKTETDAFFKRWLPIESRLTGQQFFAGSALNLVDSTFAPIFYRAFRMKRVNEDPRWGNLPKTRKWGENLMAHEAVKKSVVPEFDELFAAYLKKTWECGERLVSLTNNYSGEFL